jgi:hypothetical protein
MEIAEMKRSTIALFALARETGLWLMMPHRAACQQMLVPQLLQLQL